MSRPEPVYESERSARQSPHHPPRGGTARIRAGRSLYARISAAILLTAVAVLFVGCTLFMVEQHRAEAVVDRRANQQLVTVLGEGTARDFARHDDAATLRDLQLLRFFDRVSWGEVAASDGRRLTYHPHGTPPSSKIELFRAPLTVDGRNAGVLTIAVLPLSGATALGHYLAMGGALFFAATALALFLGRWLAARITGPVAELIDAMEAVGGDEGFQVRVNNPSADEIGRLAERFNSLMARLQVKDVALRRTLDVLVEARDAAEAANLAKSQFLANMSHEIRTPLNGVLAMAQILACGPLETAQRDQVEVIRQSGEALLALLNDILDVSKIEAGKLELEAAEFDLEEVVLATAASFAPLAERKGLRFDVRVEPESRGLRLGDAGRLRQILSNFLSNALKFTEEGGVRLRVGGLGSDGVAGVQLSVEDTGIGIAPEKQSLLFQKFTQLDASTTRRFGGTGLGLAICRELAELMGGEVSVVSTSGCGSTFHVMLPIPRVAEAPPRASGGELVRSDEPATPFEAGAQAPSAESGEADGLRVLAAEDNATNQMVLTTVMQIFGVDLTLVADGEEAVEAWREGAYDIVLMDIQMPRMDGVEATRLIRAEEAAAGRPYTPILALSANALPDQVEAYLAAGMDGHVAKPIELVKLQAALEAALQARARGVQAAA
jgi:two-component system, sensor histidine kinase